MQTIASLLVAVAASVAQPTTEAAPPQNPFKERGYYITFMRMPTYDLAAWKHIVDGIHDDGGNLLLLWMGGAFRSKRFPITWKYNKEHGNVRHDFVRDLIDHAHTRGVRVLLAFTPFGYDGANQYPLEHPELKATGKDGKPVGKAGIGCWGYNLCPSKPESQRFMLEYVREMLFDFYPNADGLMIESSDYAICHCPDCGQRFFEKEFGFVRQISQEVWAKKPEAMIVVYPHYFSGAEVPGFGIRAAKLPFDPRWTLFFTPHSAHLDPALIRQARHSLWWDESPALRRPQDIQQGAIRARNAGVTGYVPSLEAYSFVPTEAEEGQAWLKGRRQVPLGFGWLKEGDPPYDELPMRVNRIAYREFCRNPDLPFARFKEKLGWDVFGNASTPQLVEDLLELQAIFATERTWCQPSPIVCPERVRAMKSQGRLTPKKEAEYRAALARLQAMESRHRDAGTEGERQLLRIARWVLAQWQGEREKGVSLHLPVPFFFPQPSSRVPKPLRQGEFLPPQSIAAVQLSPDGRHVAVATMAFRHDRNFWLLADDGRVLWGRYLDPWAPWQVAFLPQGKRLAVGLAYSRFTMPNPTFALFDGEKDVPIYASDAAWELAWMRYGSGDWRTGWMPSLLGDMLAAADASLFTAPLLTDDKAQQKPGDWRRDPGLGQRAWRMTARCGGSLLACGFLAVDNRKAQIRGVPTLESPGVTLAAIDSTSGKVRWKAGPISPAPAVPLPPEPTDEFRPLAEDFHVRPLAMVPFRAALSVAVSRKGDRVACTEYGGCARIGQERIHPNWSPRHPIWFCPRQQGWLRVFSEDGKEVARSVLPQSGLFEVHLSSDGKLAWCVPMSWFARGLAGCPWLPADEEADKIFVFDLTDKEGKRGQSPFVQSRAPSEAWSRAVPANGDCPLFPGWSKPWRFPDAVGDFAVNPGGQGALVSCWDGRLYLIRCDGTVQATVEVGGPARLQWSADGRFAVAGTQQGEVWRVNADGKAAWHTAIPIRKPQPLTQPIKPVFDGVPIYRVGRVGPEHAYVGDIWLIKTSQGGILVDTGGTSAIADTWERIKSAGVDPRQIHYVLLSHTHGDHVGAAYLWRSLGAKVVAPAPAAFPATWMIPTMNHYGIWVPSAIDMPLPLARPGDTTRFTLEGLDIQAIFAPGHSFDTVVYVMQLAGKRVILTGDIAFHGSNHILDRCWGDLPKARTVMRILREQVLPLEPQIVISGHDARDNAMEYWQNILRASEEAVRRAEDPKK